jgi:spore maturation protein CgeB
VTPSRPASVALGSRVVLVSPVFHGLHEAISLGLQQLGLQVHTVVYDARQGAVAKARGKLMVDAPAQLGIDTKARVMSRTTAAVHNGLSAIDYDILLVIKGDVLDQQLIADQAARGKRTVLWMYDAIVNTHHSVDSLTTYDTIASFSPSDVENFVQAGLNARFVPLAADQSYCRQAPITPRGPDVVFFGARYDQREGLLSRLDEHGFSLKAYGRDWSRHPRDRLRSLSWHRPDFPTATDLPRSNVSDVANQSVSVLNMHNRKQDGFNLRTFEVPGASGLQLIDRPDVAQFYEPGAEVIVYSSFEEAVAAIEHAKREPQWASKIRQAGWRRTQAEHLFSHRVAALLA